MKFTLNWLKQYLETDRSLEEIVETLTMIGLEVEDVHDPAKDLSSFKIAHILDAKPHPDADKLQVCKVDTGSEQLQIVCGAPNARAGIDVVLAPVGTIIPTNGMKIRESKIRGVESKGMLCSAAELGIGDDHQGIIELPACNDNIAQDYVKVAGLDDPVIEIAITPNRGDCLGGYGIARDLAAAGMGVLRPLDIPQIAQDLLCPVKVVIKEKRACPMFVGCYIKDVNNGPSPDWLRQKLEAIGVNSISTLVDITNYITFAFGRPLHVYDAKKLSGDLTVRFANQGEKIKALDDKDYVLQDSMLVVADESGPQAIAGVIGGLDSGCVSDTTDVFLEVALFDPISVSQTGRGLDVITDSRYRFERNVDPAFVHEAASLAISMIVELCGGQASECVVAGGEPKWKRDIHFDFAKVKQLGGVDCQAGKAQEILGRLGFGVDGNVISVPSWRADVENDVDLVEEVVRIFGYDHIPMTTLPSAPVVTSAVLNANQIRLSKSRRALAMNGLDEVVTWSFMSGDHAQLFVEGGALISIQNPISSELNVMRPSLIPNLVQAAGKNADRGRKDLAFFETGLIYHDVAPSGQKQVVAGVRSGEFGAKNHYKQSRSVDVFDAKADVICALEAAGAPVDNLRITQDAPHYYHPGCSGVLQLGKMVIAYFGQIHPKTLKSLEIEMPVVGFEIFFDALPQPKNRKTKTRGKLKLSDYQTSTRDFAFIFDQAVAVGDVLKKVEAVDRQLIESVSLFDVYQGQNIEKGKKSVAFSVRIQPKDHTLTEAELEQFSNKIINAVSKLGGTLRS